MPGLPVAFTLGYGGSRTGGIVLWFIICSEDSNEWSGIAVLLLVPGDLKTFKAIWPFNLTNVFAIGSALSLAEKKNKSE